jgi:hypothetical protein
MKQFQYIILSVVVAACIWSFSDFVWAVPTLFQCPAPTRAVGTVGLRAPVPVPTSGAGKLQLQRSTSESTETTVNLAEFKTYRHS